MSIKLDQWEKIGYGGAGKFHYSCSRKYIELNEKNMDSKLSIASIYYRTGIFHTSNIYICCLGDQFVDDDTLNKILIKNMSYNYKSYERVTELDTKQGKVKALVIGCSELTFISLFRRSSCSKKVCADYIVDKLSN